MNDMLLDQAVPVPGAIFHIGAAGVPKARAEEVFRNTELFHGIKFSPIKRDSFEGVLCWMAVVTR